MFSERASRYAVALLLGLGLGAALAVLNPLRAEAFDQHHYASDEIETCFTGTDWDPLEKARVNAAVAHWEAVAYSLNINHDTVSSVCPVAKIEIDWVTDLGGALGRTGTGTNGAVWIRFAENGTNGAIPWYFGSSSTIPSGKYDFQSTASHELGHGLGLKHPEFNNTYPEKSWDGQNPVMMYGQAKKAVSRRTLRQDDRSGGEFVTSKNVLIQGYYASSVGYWGAGGGSLWDCGSYLCLSKSSSSAYGYMYMTTRMTVDHRQDRQDPSLSFKYRGLTYSTGMKVKTMVRSNTVSSNGSLGSYVYSYGPWCTDTISGSTWSTCSHGDLDTVNTYVADVRIYIRNWSLGEPHHTGTIGVDQIDSDFG
ncbi:MAG: hypothetical protein GY926_23395 [bacterium]|nr:hypothetical protein [bacterium]